MNSHKIYAEKIFEQLFPIAILLFLSLSYIYSLWRFNFDIQRINKLEYSIFFEMFFKKLSVMCVAYNIAYLTMKRKFREATIWMITFSFFLLIDKLFSSYLSYIKLYLKQYQSISIPGRIHFLFTFFFLSFMNIIKPEKVDLSILPVAINFFIGVYLANEPVLNSDIKFILLTPFLISLISSNNKPYKEASIITTSAIFFILAKSVVTFSGIFCMFLKSLGYISYSLGIFFSAFISFIAFTSGYFSFLIFQKGIPYDKPLEFLSQIHISSIGVLTALLIFILQKSKKIKMKTRKIKK
jgi:hypothetical protein